MRTFGMMNIDLQLFGDAAPAGDTGAAGTEAGSAPEVQEGSTHDQSTKRSGKSRNKGKADPFANVVFGKQSVQEQTADSAENKAETSQPKTGKEALEAKRQAYRKLIEGEYREQYVEDTQRIVKERLKNHRALLEQQQSILNLLSQRYGIAGEDLNQLRQAVENDNAYWERAADEAGLSVEQFKQQEQWRRDSAELQRLRKLQQSEQEARQLMSRLYTQEQDVKALYPDFDLGKEMKDPHFFGMVRAGIPLQHAYEVKYLDSIKEGAARNAVQTAQQQTADRMKVKSARPSENGTASRSAVIVKNDVSKLTRADRAEIARRVARGEVISF